MPARSILVLDKKESPWPSFIKEGFDDTASTVHIFDNPAPAVSWLAQGKIDIAFVDPELLSLNLAQRLKVLRESQKGFRLFGLGSQNRSLPFDDAFDGEASSMGPFQKKLVHYLEFPEKIKVLIVDDEKDIGRMIQDFLLDRVHPSFLADYTQDGYQALEWLEKNGYDLVILDVKMPILDGREIYRAIIERKIRVPVIVFFDAISGEEITDLRKIGRPAIVDKGSGQSNMPEMLALIKKLAYFG